MSSAFVPRALVVDDEVLVRNATARALNQEGFTCDLASDGAKALERLNEADYDVLICDLRMPEVNGHELAVAALAMDPRPAIIVLTGIPEPRLVRDLLSRGVDDVVGKPANYEVLALKAKAVVERRRGLGPADSEARRGADAGLEHHDLLAMAGTMTRNGGAADSSDAVSTRTMSGPRPAVNGEVRASSAAARKTERQGVGHRLGEREGCASGGVDSIYARADTAQAECEYVTEQVRNAIRRLPSPPADFDGFRTVVTDSVGLTELANTMRLMPAFAAELLALVNGVVYQASEQLKSIAAVQPANRVLTYRGLPYAIATALALGIFVGLSLGLLFS